MSLTVLHFNGYYKLPDNFDGKLIDAFKFFTDELERSIKMGTARATKKGLVEQICDEDPRGRLWDTFMEIVNAGEGTISMDARISQWCKDDGKWIDLSDSYGVPEKNSDSDFGIEAGGGDGSS